MDPVDNFEVRESDVWIVTLPKCGTTWMQEMVWLLVNNLDFETAKREPLELRSPFLEFPTFIGDDLQECLDELKNLKSPRVLKTHLPLPLLPKQIWTKKPKLIYVFRNPKDSILSGYYFRQSFGFNMDLTVNEYVEKELNEEVLSNAHFNHVLEFYKLRNEPWIHYTSFERMKKDLRSELEDVCTFLNVSITEDQKALMLKHLSFEEMKGNPQCSHVYEIERYRKKHGVTHYKENSFARRGQVGSHKDELTPEIIAKLDEWINNSLKPHNLTLDDLLLL